MLSKRCLEQARFLVERNRVWYFSAGVVLTGIVVGRSYYDMKNLKEAVESICFYFSQSEFESRF